MAGLLQLEVKEFRNLARWRWVLSDAVSGVSIADHEVRLDAAAWQFEAFADLTGYLSWHVAPDRRAEDEARIVGEVGEWIGSAVLGPVAEALVQQQPATVRVVVPPRAGELLYRPLELAHVSGAPLAVQGVTLVMDAGVAPEAAGCIPGAARLRVLGLFSLPEGGRALNLRRERVALVDLVRGIAANGKAADVRVLQYGVTRERLRDVLSEREGWDIIHVSGHGRPGSLVLETADGQPDPVSEAELADLLGLARERVQLVTLSACWSAAVIADEQRRLLGLPAQDQGQSRQGNEPERAEAGREPVTISRALATGLAARLRCAVLAMRYPVGDEFAITLSGKLYDLLARQGEPLPRALGMSLRQLSSQGARWPTLAVGTPALFGGTAVELRLAAPDRHGPLSCDTDALTIPGFPPSPERFVGRTGVLARSSATLAPGSGVPGVLLHGMPGGGKTACALELAYGHEELFDHLVFYKAPDDGLDVSGALTDFAHTLGQYLPDLGVVHLVASANANAMAGFLSRLTELLERRRVLVVLDNCESLLSDSGQWRDKRWGQVISALCAHSGRGRLILTSRRLPADALPGLRVEAVDALSPDEALLLARELPNLKALELGKAPRIGAALSRKLARNAIELAKGHPKLLELAEGQAANPDHLLELARAGTQEWVKLDSVPDGFFAVDGGRPAATADDYLQVIATWTKSVTGTLAPGERDQFWFLCCLEEQDRVRYVLDGIWSLRDGQPPDLDAALAVLTARSLIAKQITAASGYFSFDKGKCPSSAVTATDVYLIHPGVAAAGRSHAGQSFREAIDEDAAKFWGIVHTGASMGMPDGAVDTHWARWAGLAAAPYLLRQRRWDEAAQSAESAVRADQTRVTAALALPTLRQAANCDPSQAGRLFTVLQLIDPAAAETAWRDRFHGAVTRGDNPGARDAAWRLGTLHGKCGRFNQALNLIQQGTSYTDDTNPWSRLADQVHQLRVLNSLGYPARVLAEVHHLRSQMDALPPQIVKVGELYFEPWTVREPLLQMGVYAASQLGQWEAGLALSADIATSERDRNAPPNAVARTQYDTWFSLVHLERSGEALDLLRHCLEVFQDTHDTEMLGKTLGALAQIESLRGHGDAAIRLVRDALRYNYLANDAASIAVSYNNLGRFLGAHTREPTPALASHLASALICTLTGFDGALNPVAGIADNLNVLGTATTPPADISDLNRQLGDIPGTDLPSLIARLSESQNAEQTLRDLISQAQALAAQESQRIPTTAGPKRLWRRGL